MIIMLLTSERDMKMLGFGTAITTLNIIHDINTLQILVMILLIGINILFNMD